MSGEASGETPGRDIASQLFDSLPAVNVNEVDGELHPEGVDRFAGHDPKASAWRQALAPEEALASFGTRVGLLEAGGEHGFAGEVCHAQKVFRGWLGIESHFTRYPFLLDWRYDQQSLRQLRDAERTHKTGVRKQSLKGAIHAPFKP
jgi:hypothetical protein